MTIYLIIQRWLCSVEFKMVSRHLEKPMCAPPSLREVSPTLLLKQFNSSSDWRWLFLALCREIVECFLFPHFSPPGSQWCAVHGFWPTSSVSSSSTLQIFWHTNHLWWLLCPQVYLLSNFPSLWHVHGSIPLGVSLYTDSTEKGSSRWRGKEWNAFVVGVLL